MTMSPITCSIVVFFFSLFFFAFFFSLFSPAVVDKCVSVRGVCWCVDLYLCWIPPPHKQSSFDRTQALNGVFGVHYRRALVLYQVGFFNLRCFVSRTCPSFSSTLIRIEFCRPVYRWGAWGYLVENSRSEKHLAPHFVV